MVINLGPHCPPKNVYLCFWNSGVYPAAGCRMRPKSLPEAARQGQQPAGSCQMPKLFRCH